MNSVKNTRITIRLVALKYRGFTRHWASGRENKGYIQWRLLGKILPK